MVKASFWGSSCYAPLVAGRCLCPSSSVSLGGRWLCSSWAYLGPWAHLGRSWARGGSVVDLAGSGQGRKMHEFGLCLTIRGQTLNDLD